MPADESPFWAKLLSQDTAYAEWRMEQYTDLNQRYTLVKITATMSLLFLILTISANSAPAAACCGILGALTAVHAARGLVVKERMDMLEALRRWSRESKLGR